MDGLVGVTEIKRINLALQGGGAHGAYSWGVLDRLLEEERLEIEAISGTSAGAMNAAALVDGFMEGGREGAKRELKEFWRRVSDASSLGPIKQSVSTWLYPWNVGNSFVYSFMDAISRMVSPYDFNPLNLNPLRAILEDTIKIERLRESSKIKMFITATRVCDGQPRVFGCHEMSLDVIMASACLPFLFQAVNIQGDDYWDGGYMGNPAIWPLIYRCDALDVLLVQINPLYRKETPMAAPQILNRVNEITFNSSLIAEMRAIDFVARLIEKGALDRAQYKHMNMHMVAWPKDWDENDFDSKSNTDWGFFQHLHRLGYAAGDAWLKKHWKDIGVKGTLDIPKVFLGQKQE